jgi:hypothetical protein
MRSQRTFALYIKGTEFYRESFKSIPEKWTAPQPKFQPKLVSSQSFDFKSTNWTLSSNPEASMQVPVTGPAFRVAIAIKSGDL